MKASEILSKAADLIATPGVWIQGDYSTDQFGEVVSSNHERACHFCAWGAIERVAGRQYDADGEQALRMLHKFLGGDIEAWNDREGRTQADVVAALRGASELAKQSEAA